jgi:hypothetical protein
MPGKVFGRLLFDGSNAVPTRTAAFALGKEETPIHCNIGFIDGIFSTDICPRIMW